MEDMHYEGINYGILEMEIPQEFETGYLHIFPVDASFRDKRNASMVLLSSGY